MSFSRTLRATSSSCCQVVVSIGTPFFSRSTRRARSGSPGASTSATPGCGLADFTQVMKVSTSSSNIAVPPIAVGIDDDRQHVVDDVGAVLLDGARAVRAAAGQRAGQQVADHREAAALVQAERQDGAVGRVVHHAGIGGGLAGGVDQQAFVHLHLLVVGDADLAHRHLAGGEVEHDRLLALARHGGAVGVGGEARLGAAERRHQRLVAVHVHPVRAHHAGARALLGPVADAPDVMGVGEADDADAVLFGALDADIHRLLGDHLAVAGAAVDHDDGTIILHDLCMMVTDAGARRGVLDIGRHHADAVAVVAEQVGQHQMVCNQPGLLGRAAVGPADRHGEGVQPIGLHPHFAHAAAPLAIRACPRKPGGKFGG